MSSYFTVRHSRSTKTLSRQRPRPSMLTATPADSSRPVHACAVNCTPWSVLNTSGCPRRNASSNISRQKEPSSVFDSRHASSSHCRRTLNSGCSGSTRVRSRSGECSNFFFEPLQLHLEPADLLEQLGLLGLGVRRGRLAAGAEDLVGPGEQLLLPGVDQGRMDPVLARQFVDGPVP